MQGKSILITGAGSGIGRETARLFARRGWLVGAVDVAEAAVAALAAEFPAGTILPIVADVRSADGARAMVEALTAKTGGTLDVLFNCAGVLRMGPYETVPPADRALTVDVNITGVLNGLDAAFEALKRTPGAHVVSMSSTSAEYGTPDLAVYSASKFFVRGLTEALNIEWARHDINVSALLVAYVRTPMIVDATVKARSVDTLGVKVSPETVAAAVWKAAHSSGSLHRVGFDAVVLDLVVRLLGRRVRGLYRMLTGY
jgi:NAD(P)-dependent dehydrogenase (short-subunit alcohol dehydrogenase family)